MNRFALDERADCAATLRSTDPDAPTLCAPWNAAELTAHMVLREATPVQLIALLGGPFHRFADGAVGRFARGRPWSDLVGRFAAGPPWYSPLALPPVRERADLLEYVVHHEDIRRAGELFTPRPIPVARQAAVFSGLRMMSRVTLRSSPVGVTLAWPSEGEIVARRGRGGRTVRVVGDPVELALVAFGRQRVAKVDYVGSSEDVAAFTGASFSV